MMAIITVRVKMDKAWYIKFVVVIDIKEYYCMGDRVLPMVMCPTYLVSPSINSPVSVCHNSP